jgi:sulfur carrier protein ThiS adenylyltransferase
VAATAKAITAIDQQIVISQIEDRFRPKHTAAQAVFCCVDSIATRAAIWRSLGRQCRFWSDGRMLGEVMRILTVAGDSGRYLYPTTLFESSEAQTGHCTARSTIYTASIAAGLMLHQFARWLRGQATDPDLSLNLLASELTPN